MMGSKREAGIRLPGNGCRPKPLRWEASATVVRGSKTRIRTPEAVRVWEKSPARWRGVGTWAVGVLTPWSLFCSQLKKKKVLLAPS
jgi:hypothetical protein